MFRHPLHSAVVHFPIAFWVLAGAADAAWLFIDPDPFFARSALWLQGAGLIAAGVAVLAGVLDLGGLKTRPKAVNTVGIHITLMVSATSAAALSFFGRTKLPLEEGVFTWPIGASFAAAGLVLAGAYFGGELVYRYGFGAIKDEN